MRWWCRVLTCYTNSSNSYLMCCVNTVPCSCCSMEASQQSRSRSHLCYWLPSQMDTACCIRNNDVHSSGLNGSQQIPGSLQEYRHWKNYTCALVVWVFAKLGVNYVLHAFIKPRAACTWHGFWCQQGTGMACHTPPSVLTWFPDKIRLVLMRFIFDESHQKELIMHHFLPTHLFLQLLMLRLTRPLPPEKKPVYACAIYYRKKLPCS